MIRSPLMEKMETWANKTNAMLLKYGLWFLAFCWWLLLFVFASSGSGKLGIMWVALVLPCFFLHPDVLVDPSTWLKHDENSVIKIIGILVSALVYMFTLTCLAWSVGYDEGVFTQDGDIMFHVIGVGFALMCMFAMWGIITFVFVPQTGKKQIFIFVYGSVPLALPWALNKSFPGWLFNKGIAKWAEEITVMGIVVSLIAWTIYVCSEWVMAKKVDSSPK